MLLITALSLVAWCAFYAFSEPLEPDETVVVVGVCAGVVFFSKWIWGRLRQNGGKK